MSDFFTRLALRTIDTTSPAFTTTKSNVLTPNDPAIDMSIEESDEGTDVMPEAHARPEQSAPTGDVPPVDAPSAPASSSVPPAPRGAIDTGEPHPLGDLPPAGDATRAAGQPRIDASITADAPRSSEPPRHEARPRDLILPFDQEEETRPSPRRASERAPTAGEDAVPATNDAQPFTPSPGAPPRPLEPALPFEGESGTIEETRYERPFVESGVREAHDAGMESGEEGAIDRSAPHAPIGAIAPASPISPMPHDEDATGGIVPPSEITHHPEATAGEPRRESAASNAVSFFRRLFAPRREDPPALHDAPAERRGDAPRTEREPAVPSLGTLRPFVTGEESLDVELTDDGAIDPPTPRANEEHRAPLENADRPAHEEKRESDSDRSSTRPLPSQARPLSPASMGHGIEEDGSDDLPGSTSPSRAERIDAASDPRGGMKMGSTARESSSDARPSDAARRDTHREAERTTESRRQAQPRRTAPQESPRERAVRPLDPRAAREIARPLKAEVERIEQHLADGVARASEAGARAERREAPRAQGARPMASHDAESSRGAMAELRRESPPPPVIRVSIGRVEVRAEGPSAPTPPQAAARPRGPALSLSDYLKQRNRGHQ